MDTSADRSTGNSATDNSAMFFSFPASAAMQKGGFPNGLTWAARQYAQGTLVSLTLLETWLANYRNVADTMRATMRQQQDAFLTNLHQQLESSAGTKGGSPAPADGKAGASARPERKSPPQARESA